MDGGGAITSRAGTLHRQLSHDTAGAGRAAMPLQLLDLPTELLNEVLQRAPRCSARSTCRTFRDLVDAGQQALSLRPPSKRGAPRRLQHLSALLRRLPALTSLSVHNFEFKTLTFCTACPALASLTLADAPDVPDKALQSLAACPQLTSLNLTRCSDLKTISVTSTFIALQTLDLTGCHLLTSLEPLTHCPHITSLNFGGRVTTLSPLTALASLASLTCTSGRITDLSPLSRHTRLASLKVDSYELANLAPLALFGSSLTLLSLAYCRADDLRPLAFCASLTWLALEEMDGIADISFISSCTALSTLLLDACLARVCLTPLSCLGRTITSLSVVGCADVDSVLPLASCVALTKLELEGFEKLTDVSPLSSCTALSCLALYRCDSLVSLTPLSCLGRSLTSLTLSDCTQVTSVLPLASCAALTCLALEGLEVLVDISPLTSCTALSTLTLCDCDSLISLAALPAFGRSLTSLSLDGCHNVASILPLASCMALTHLDLSYIAVTATAPLALCRGLKTLRAMPCHIPPEQLLWLQQQLPRLQVEADGAELYD